MKRVREALLRRLGGLPGGTTCFRWLDEELSGVTVDLFGDVAVLGLYRDAGDDEERALADALAEARPLRAVYVKRRPREARDSGRHVDDAAPPSPIWGEPVESLVAEEASARFLIRPPNGLSVGLYLDARDARAWVRAHAAGKRVLNTFAYTCGFGVAAHLGGAARVVNVDASRRVLDWGTDNMALNGLDARPEDFLSGDAFDWLQRFEKKGQRFDLVVLDPPGFATTRRSRFSAQRDYHRLVEAAARVMDDGLLLAMCNVAALSEAEVSAQVRRGLGARRFEVAARFGASPVDFRQPSALKCLAVKL